LRPDLAADPRFADSSARLANREPLRAEIERTLIDFPAAALCDKLMRHGVPAGPVNNVAQALSQPHAAHRAMVVDQQGHRSLGLPIKLSATPGRAGALPPRLSEHANAILAEMGYGSAAIESLHAEGTVTRPPQ
jgi:crotonobetainyl-CoA:carnitine CoA-transferase CaiB-like acyl-CoA transferase